jgi:diguanylate cyclase (GGDEF)-like protein
MTRPDTVSGLAGHVRRPARRFASWQVWALPEPLRSYVVTVPVLATAAIADAAVKTPLHPRPVLIFAGFEACGIIATEANRAVPEPQGGLIRDLQSVWYLAIAITLPPGFAFAAPLPMAAHKLWRIRRGRTYRRVFSHAVISLSYGLAAMAFRSLPSSVTSPAPGSGTHALIWVAAVTCCGLAGGFLNHGTLLAAIRLSDPGAPLRDFVNAQSLSADVLELSVAVSLTALVTITPALMALVLPAVILGRRYIMQLQLVMQARLDPATGLLNTATWQREAQAEFDRARLAGTPLTLLLIAIDQFSTVKETGPNVAHEVVREVAQALAEKLTAPSLTGRHGDAEFAVLLPQSSGGHARKVAERLRDAIAATPIAIEANGHGSFIFRLTISIGAGTFDHRGPTFADLARTARTALAWAQDTGGNTVRVATPPRPRLEKEPARVPRQAGQRHIPPPRGGSAP